MKRIIFWDWTGTLADESQLDKAVCQTIEEEIAKKGNMELSDAKKAFEDHLKKLENTWEWHDYVLHGNHFGLDWEKPQRKNLDKLILLPGVKEILIFAKDKGYRNILATNAVRGVVLMRLTHAGLMTFFEAIIASDDVQALKSEGEHFAQGLRILEGSAHLSFSVGNNPVQDITPAKQMNMRTILCEFGKELIHYHSQHISDNCTEMALPDYRIRNLLEIKNII